MKETIYVAAQVVEKASFFSVHFDTIITVFITILGFVITYLMTKKNFNNEVIKNKLAINADMVKNLPYEVCELMDRMMHKGTKKPLSAGDVSDLLAKILSYGSRDAVSIAIHMQQLIYSNSDNKDIDKNQETLACYSLLISQIKYDLTSEIISPESWFKLKINDYETERQKMVKNINSIVNKLHLTKYFQVKSSGIKSSRK